MGKREVRLLLAVGLWLLVAVGFRSELEATMLGHALVQLPALVLAGHLLVPRAKNRSLDPLALPVLLVAIFATAVWMLPRMLDASLGDPRYEAAKLATLPLLVGVPLAWSWPRLSVLARAFVWSNLLSMLLTLGWLYKAAPTRVCNYYLLEEQQLLGTAMLSLAAAITLGLLPRLFLGAQASGSGRRRQEHEISPASARWEGSTRVPG
jgi:hypothetical protein